MCVCVRVQSITVRPSKRFGENFESNTTVLRLLLSNTTEFWPLPRTLGRVVALGRQAAYLSEIFFPSLRVHCTACITIATPTKMAPMITRLVTVLVCFLAHPVMTITVTNDGLPYILQFYATQNYCGTDTPSSTSRVLHESQQWMQRYDGDLVSVRSIAASESKRKHCRSAVTILYDTTDAAFGQQHSGVVLVEPEPDASTASTLAPVLPMLFATVVVVLLTGAA